MAAGLREKLSASALEKFTHSPPTSYYSIPRAPSACFPDLPQFPHYDTEPWLTVTLVSPTSRCQIPMVLSTGSERVELPYELVGSILKPDLTLEDVSYGFIDMIVDGVEFKEVPYAASKPNMELEHLRTEGNTDQAKWLFGVQRLLGRMGFMDRATFTCSPSPNSLDIEFKAQRKRVRDDSIAQTQTGIIHSHHKHLSL